MTYIVLDLEFNQGFNFEKNKTANIIPECRFEIIQIGAIKLNQNLEVVDKINLYIKLNLYKEMHPHVKKLTGLDKEFLKDKLTFYEAYRDFSNFINKNNEDDNTIYCVWGSGDLRALYRNMRYYGILNINDSLILKYIDIQQIATEYLKFSKGGYIGLKHAIELLELPIEEVFHDALNDAKYTADIFKKIGDNSDIKNIIKVFNSKNVPNRSKS
ncbi:MAG: 3'-5' exonuclease [bacterium]